MKYRFKTVPSFRRSLRKLSSDQKKAAKTVFAIFKQNPFDQRLRTRKIHHLSAEYKATVYSVRVLGDLRAVFYIDGDTVWSVDIGTHSIYHS